MAEKASEQFINDEELPESPLYSDWIPAEFLLLQNLFVLANRDAEKFEYLKTLASDELELIYQLSRAANFAEWEKICEEKRRAAEK